MKTLKEILSEKNQVVIGGEAFSLMYNHAVLKSSPLTLDLAGLSLIASDGEISLNEKLQKMAAMGSEAIPLIMAGIRTHVLIENSDLQAIETGLPSKKSQEKLKEVELVLNTVTSTGELIGYVMVCITALTDFMPKVTEGGGENPPPLSRGKVKKEALPPGTGA